MRLIFHAAIISRIRFATVKLGMKKSDPSYEKHVVVKVSSLVLA